MRKDLDEEVWYCKGYKYQLRKNFRVRTRVHPGRDLITELVELRRDGELTVRKYFAWDGCSGPTWDDRTNMRGCLVHDALYYLLRAGLLGQAWRPEVDAELQRLMEMDSAGRSFFCRGRAWVYRWTCTVFGSGSAVKPRKILKI